jgi:SAM-dependent methyltransferase
VAIDWWVTAEPVEAACPACENVGPHSIRAVIDEAASPLLTCVGCASAFWAQRNSADYLAPTSRAWMYYRAELEDSMDAPFRDLEALSAAASIVFAGRDQLTFVDVGSGVGFAADMAQHIYGWDAIGIDPGDVSAFAANEWAMATTTGTFPTDYQGKAPELLFCSEVIEHVENPVQFLRDLYSGMASESLLLLTTPTVELIAPTTDSDELMQVLFLGEHLQYFSVAALKSRLVQAGFELQGIHTHEARRSVLASKGQVPHVGWPAQQPDPSRMRSYLLERNLTAPPLVRIFGSRAYAMAVNQGDLAESNDLWRGISRAYESVMQQPVTPKAAEHAADAVRSRYVDSVDQFPANLAFISYLRAMHLLLQGGAHAETLEWLRAADSLARAWEDGRQQFSPLSPRDGHLRMIPLWVSQQIPVALERRADHLGTELQLARGRIDELERFVGELVQSGEVSTTKFEQLVSAWELADNQRHLDDIREQTRTLRHRLSEAQMRRDHLGEELTREHERYHATLQSRSMQWGMAVTAPVRNWRSAGRIRPVVIAEPATQEPIAADAAVVPESKFAPVNVQIDLAPITQTAGLKVALIAGWDARGQISAATTHLARGFADAGFAPVLVSSKGHDSDWISLNESQLRETFHAVLSADHTARDFRSWQIAFDSLDGLADASELILVNDSVIGAFFDPSDFLAALTQPGVDVRGALESHGPVPHLQSWLLWFGPRVMADRALQRYLSRYEPGLTKRELIESMEVPLAFWFGQQGYEVNAAGNGSAVHQARTAN